MSDNPQNPEIPTQDSTPEQSIPYSRFQQVIKQKNDYEAKLKSYEDAEQARLQAEQLAKGEHEKVIADLRPKAERLTQVEAALGELLTSELASIAEERRAGVDIILNAIPTIEGKLASLRALQSTFMQAPVETPRPTAPNLNGGAGNGSSTKPTGSGLEGLTDKQLTLVQAARDSGHIRDMDSFIKRLKETRK